ncbi:MAG: BrnT family toxin [Schwartzia sp.]|nr:BrnT family toxin [Schwartzia sp. (in: firmicutes)]MBR1886759.1 BrnT family toxin [Schwartzia sp. (in: firmicutes)]
MNFEWDENKNLLNRKKHGITFEYASLVFKDEYRMEDYDADHSGDEDRYTVTGRVQGIIVVVCTYREEDVVRIISAREATKDERRRYEWQWLE